MCVDRDDRITQACVGLDRAFIESRSEAFARDLAKSFLIWAPADLEHAGAEALIANIADFGASRAPVIMRGVPPQPEPDRTGCYAVFLGRAETAVLVLPAASIEFANFPGSLPGHAIFSHSRTAVGQGRWLRISVIPK